MKPNILPIFAKQWITNINRCIGGSWVLQHPPTYKDLERSDGICHQWKLCEFQTSLYIYIITSLGLSKSCVSSAPLPGRRIDTNVIHPVWWLENESGGFLWTLKSKILLYHTILCNPTMAAGEYWITVFLQQFWPEWIFGHRFKIGWWTTRKGFTHYCQREGQSNAFPFKSFMLNCSLTVT